MISMSFYLSELMGLYFDVKRKDFWPMFTHHVISILLLFFAWKCNFNRITMAGIFLLDCNDILLEVLIFPDVIKITVTVTAVQNYDLLRIQQDVFYDILYFSICLDSVKVGISSLLDSKKVNVQNTYSVLQ
jgi:hypothetical protein